MTTYEDLTVFCCEKNIYLHAIVQSTVTEFSFFIHFFKIILEIFKQISIVLAFFQNTFFLSK